MKGIYRMEHGEKIFEESKGKYRTLASYYEDKKGFRKWVYQECF